MRAVADVSFLNDQLERGHEAALRIVERVHGSLDLDEVLGFAVEELGRAARASRCRLRVVHAPEDLEGPLYHWQRLGPSPLDFAEGPVLAEQFLTLGERVFVRDVGVVGGELREYVERFRAVSFLGCPVAWAGRTVAVLGLFDDRPRDWARDTLPLLERVLPQVAIAIAQAELFRQQQQTVARLEELTSLRERFVANVSHELRTPLTSTIGFLRTLERTDVDLPPERRAEFLRIAREHAERLAVLVSDLLDLARLDHGGMALSPQATPLAATVGQAAAGLTLAPGRELRLEVSDALVAWADPERLLQVLSNLIVNAIRHGAGDILVRGTNAGPGIEIAVSDDGPGVLPEHMPELFVPFARWSQAEGTGLGLAIARAISEAHGGSLVYRPRLDLAPHAFVVSLPAAEAKGGPQIARTTDT